MLRAKKHFRGKTRFHTGCFHKPTPSASPLHWWESGFIVIFWDTLRARDHERHWSLRDEIRPSSWPIKSFCFTPKCVPKNQRLSSSPQRLAMLWSASPMHCWKCAFIVFFGTHFGVGEIGCHWSARVTSRQLIGPVDRSHKRFCYSFHWFARPRI